MKKNIKGKNVVKALSFVLSASMILQPVAALAEEVEGSVNAASELNVSGDDVKSAVDAAEEAAEAAYMAQLAAQAALEEANKLDAKITDEKSYQNYEDETAEEENNLSDAIDDLVIAAIDAEGTADQAVDAIREKEAEDIEALANKADTSVSENLAGLDTKISDADKAEDKAYEALQNTETKTYKDEALVEAGKAQAAANLAKQAETEATEIYNEADKAYTDALEEYERLVALADENADNVAKNFDETQKAAALEAIATAKSDLEAKEEAYKLAMENKKTAEEAANLAAEKAGVALEKATELVDDLAELKNIDSLATLEERKANQESLLDEAKTDKTKADEKNDPIIAEQTGIKNAADAESAEHQKDINKATQDYNNANTAYSNAQKSYNNNIATSKKTTNDVKETKWVWDGPFWGHNKNIYYTQAEIDNAKKAVEQAEKDMEAANLAKEAAMTAKGEAEEAKKISDKKASDAQKEIDAANKEKSNAVTKVTNAETELANTKVTLSYLTNYYYGKNGETTDVKYLDKDELATFKKLMKEMDESFDQYTELSEDTEDYREATDGYDGFMDWLKHFWGDQYTEKRLENKYRNWNWKWENGEETHWTFTTNGSNLAVLISLTGDKLTMTTIDEAEFATYSASFDMVAAANAAAKAAQAKEAEAAALSELEAAKTALKEAEERVNLLSVDTKKSDLALQERAAQDLEAAKGRLEKAKEELSKATSEANKAQEEADEALRIANAKALRPSNNNNEEEPEAITDEEEVVVPSARRRAAAPTETTEVVEEVSNEPEAVLEIADEPVAEVEAPVEEEVVIEEEETPLAAEAVEKSKMNWWWILIVLALLTAGEETYRRYQLKKKAANATEE